MAHGVTDDVVISVSSHYVNETVFVLLGVYFRCSVAQSKFIFSCLTDIRNITIRTKHTHTHTHTHTHARTHAERERGREKEREREKTLRDMSPSL